MAGTIGSSTEIEHISLHHPHPLTLIDAEKEGRFRCDGCLSPIIDDPGFGCRACGFFLHDACTKLPLELPQHPLHPNDLLKLYLIELEFAGENKTYWCKICNGYIVEGFVYKCVNENCSSGCSKAGCFLIHSRCALIDSSISFPNHKHQLFSITESYCRASCALCGLDLEYRKDGVNLYRCLECDIRVHVSCFSHFPSTIERSAIHPHTLNLYLDPLSEDFEDYGTCCNVCKEERAISEGFYCCKQCYFTCHVQCVNYGVQADESDEDSGYHSLKHRFHFCNLDFHTSIVNEGGLRCAGCQLHFDDDPGFGCEACGFFLHEGCAKSPSKLQHPLHPDARITLERIGELYSLPQTEDYLCQVCYLPIDKRFFYECKGSCGRCFLNGKFRIHMNCAELVPSIIHPGHNHRLVFMKTGVYPKNCVACGAKILSSKSGFYRCLNCNFGLHKECFDLPHEDGRTDDRLHPLTLYYRPLPEDYDEDDYYCDWCNERRDVHTFSYVCRECDYICHTRCDALKTISSQIEYLETSEENGPLQIETSTPKSPCSTELYQHSETCEYNNLLLVKPLVLKFLFELNKRISCFVLLENKSSNRVAFKLKVTNPKMYGVFPHDGFLQPFQKSRVKVIMQRQQTTPLGMQCKGKFMIQSVILPQGHAEEYITKEMFCKEGGHYIEETILSVIYVNPHQ